MRYPAVVAIAAIVGISLCAAYTISGALSSNAPPQVVFTLGTAHRDMTSSANPKGGNRNQLTAGAAAEGEQMPVT